MRHPPRSAPFLCHSLRQPHRTLFPPLPQLPQGSRSGRSSPHRAPVSGGQQGLKRASGRGGGGEGGEAKGFCRQPWAAGSPRRRGGGEERPDPDTPQSYFHGVDRSVHPPVRPSIPLSVHPSVRPSTHPSSREAAHPRCGTAPHGAGRGHEHPQPTPSPLLGSGAQGTTLPQHSRQHRPGTGMGMGMGPVLPPVTPQLRATPTSPTSSASSHRGESARQRGSGERRGR